MKKILLAIDALNPATNALDFAAYIARLVKAPLTGVFLENFVVEERAVVKQLYNKTFVDWEVDENSDEHLLKMAVIEKNIANFKESCTRREINFKIHRDRGTPAEELIAESRFADLLIVDAETSFSRHYEGSPTVFVKNILQKAECPIIIAPNNFDMINEVCAAYDGSASSVYALKQFTYLFPELLFNKINIVQVNESGIWHDTEKYRLKEWLKMHYSNMDFQAKKGNTDKELINYVMNRKNAIVIMGAYGRNSLSLYFSQSHADMLIKTMESPIFITHI